MALFINRDQIFAHQIHLLEHKLRSKEERILELQTENVLLHLRLTECMGKLQRIQEAEILAEGPCQHRGDSRQHPHAALTRVLSSVQSLKQDLKGVVTLHAGFATELERWSLQLLQCVATADRVIQKPQSDETQKFQAQLAALENSLQEEKERCRTERTRRRLLHNTLVELRGNIRVHCRVRPILPLDHSPDSLVANLSTSSEVVVVKACSEDSVLVNCSKPGSPVVDKMFEFERVHGPEDTQEAVFEEVKPLLTSLLDGYNVCIMAYGQTGSGKTYTMIGSQSEDSTITNLHSQLGIVPRATEELFKLISEKPAETHTVEVSVMEVYNNELLDLLAKDEGGVSVGVKREVVTSSCGSSEVPCLTYKSVHSSVEVMHLISSVLRLRAHGPTLVHRDSSRSHLIITLTITSKSPHALTLAHRLRSARRHVQRTPPREWWSPRCHRNASSQSSSSASSPYDSPCPSPVPSPRSSISPAPLRTKLQLVDLAGSECVGMSGVSGPALWENSCINRSLSALSDVLGALAEYRAHVPYRNTRLTHLLQDCIGGDAKLLVMLCVSPSQRFLTESLQALGFGSRARQVQRDPPRRKNTALKRK